MGMRKLLVIGIGAGDPDYLTVQAIKALNRVEVFFVIDKGSSKDDLVALRREICERFIDGDDYRFVELADPPRDRGADAYAAAVEDWYDQRAALFEAAITADLGPDGCGGFLVWGDPSLYDGTLRILERILARGQTAFEYEVIPGITSVQALTAKHRTTLNQVGGSVSLTTGRRLAAGVPESVDDVVVMLDSNLAATELDGDWDIFWGANIGTPDELLVAGRLADVADEIAARRAALRAEHGWVMDTYLLRRR